MMYSGTIMNRPINYLSGVVYRKILKPILFLQKPDGVHVHLLKVGGLAQKSSLIRTFLYSIWAYENARYLRQTLHGVTFRNPVGLSAGFDKNFKLVGLMKCIGFGFMEGGSLTYHPCAGNEKPWFYRLPKSKSLVVHVGLANQGVEEILQRINTLPATVRKDFPLNISIARTNSASVSSDEDGIADYMGSLRAILEKDTGEMITINISCPNAYGGEPFTTPGRLDTLLSEIDTLHIKKPLFIKMPLLQSWPEARLLIEVAAKHRVTGLVISNLAKDRSNIILKDPLPVEVKGSLSGKPTWEISNELIRQTYREFGDRLTIIGVGGIFTAQDAYTKIRLGASLIELITGMIFEGPQQIGEINRGLVELLIRDGYTNVSQAIGVDA